MKKIIICLAMVMALTGCSQKQTETAKGLTDGTYTKDVTGHNAPFTVEVTVKDGKVSEINTLNEQETRGIGQVAISILEEKIIEKQSAGVDSITGATVSSAALKMGVLDCIEQAGGDKSEWKADAEDRNLQDETLTADVVVIGGGGAGMAAAVAAADEGANVIIVEKNGYLGGSTQTSGGAYNAADPELRAGYTMTEALAKKIEGYITKECDDETVKSWQESLKSEWEAYKASGSDVLFDSVSLHEIQTYFGGHNTGTPALIATLCENALSAQKWVEAHGVEFKTTLGTATGALYQRSHYTTMPAGTGYNVTFKALIDSTDSIQVLTETPATELIVTDGAVTGVVCENKGRTVTINAKSVVIATGGFGSNVELRQEVNTGVWAEADLGNVIGCTNIATSAQGDGLTLASEAGANLIGLSDIQLHPCGNPSTGLMDAIRTSGRNKIFVNSDGERFVNEGAARDTLCKAIFAQEGSTYYVIVNTVRYADENTPDSNGETIANMIALGKVVKGETLDELAEKLGMNADTLKASVQQYNNAVNGTEADPLGLEITSSDVELTEGPWYACKKVPTVHHTMGGIEINSDAQVISTDGSVIEGLYAAGEVTGGIHGSNRLGGNAIADLFVFGRIAGTNAATK